MAYCELCCQVRVVHGMTVSVCEIEEKLGCENTKVSEKGELIKICLFWKEESEKTEAVKNKKKKRGHRFNPV